MELIQTPLNPPSSQLFRRLVLPLILCVLLTQTACSTHTKEVVIGGIVGALAGAGAGYLVLHHGRDRQYQVQNTIIAGAVTGLGTMAVLSWHYAALDRQKVEITSRFARNWVNDENSGQPGRKAAVGGTEYNPSRDAIGRYSLKLDSDTRWVFPTFRKRFLSPETSTDEMLSSRYSWEILRPGFFVTREQNQTYFEDQAGYGIEAPSQLEDTKPTPVPSPKPKISPKKGSRP